MKLVEIVPMLLEYGLRPFEVAKTVYNISDEEWSKLPRVKRQKLIHRIIAIRHKSRKKSSYHNTHDEVITESSYHNIDYSGGEREALAFREYASDGTANVVERKRWARDEERYEVEYEQLLYFFYTSTLSQYDDIAKTMWLSIRMVHKAVFPEFWNRYGVKAKLVWNKKRKNIPELSAAYVYSVFFFALYRFQQFIANKHYFLQKLRVFIRDNELFRHYLSELIGLFIRFLL